MIGLRIDAPVAEQGAPEVVANPDSPVGRIERLEKQIAALIALLGPDLREEYERTLRDPSTHNVTTPDTDRRHP
jgi:hypothetical protein